MNRSRPLSWDSNLMGSGFTRSDQGNKRILSHRKSPSLLLAILAIGNVLLLLCNSRGVPQTLAFVHQRIVHPAAITSAPFTAPTRTEKAFSTLLPSPRCPSTALCGIKGFRAWFGQQFPNAIKLVDGTKSKDSFDHVLVDMNQILHVILRRSRGPDHAIKLLMFELDQLLLLANPKHSLVLAIDGPPAAAKIATQRKRRFALLKNTQFKLKHFQKLRISTTQRAKRLRSYRSEIRSLQLTPGTDSMQTMEQTLLYWAWQRLQTQGRPHSKLLPNVKIYISSSRVPGEGEIKLLEWVNNFRGHLSRNPGQSIALIGGDADLLLEAVVIPPSWTHNVFVLRPEELQNRNNGIAASSQADKGNGGKKNDMEMGSRNIMLCTSVWEMTRDLDEFCRTQLSATVYNPEKNKQDQNLLLQLRTDLVLLMILNGNDYLPKAVATDFRDILDIYMTLMKRWLERNAPEAPVEYDGRNKVSSQSSSRTLQMTQVGLVDPDSLSFRRHFCTAFFHALGRDSPTDEERSKSVHHSVRRTYLSILNDMASAGFIPTPICITYFNPGSNSSSTDQASKLIAAGDEDKEDEDDNDEDDDYDGTFNDEGEETFGSIATIDDSTDGFDEADDSIDTSVLVTLTLGKPGTEEFQTYKMWSEIGIKTAAAKQTLAKKALEDSSILEVLADGEDISSTDYEWELDKPADANIERYLAGLLWTLQTYQDGVCPNYSYNYGKCMGPTGRAIAEYFEQAICDGRPVGAKELIATLDPGGPISAGLACLAALPASIDDLVPEPYSLIPSDRVEELYASCVDRSDNWFDMRNFERLVEEEVLKITSLSEGETERATGRHKREASNHLQNGRRILLGDNHWTVLSGTQHALEHPFQAPEPPSDKFTMLRPNSRIKASRVICIDRPQPRSCWNETASGHHAQNILFQKAWSPLVSLDVDHSDFGEKLLGSEAPALADLPYKIAFGQEAWDLSEPAEKQPFTLLKPKQNAPLSLELDVASTKTSPNTNDSETALSSFHNTEGMNAVVVLSRLRDNGVIGEYEFVDVPSNPTTAENRWELTVYKGFTSGVCSEENIKVIEQRNRNTSKRWMKQILAARALDLLLKHATSDDTSSPFNHWSSLSFDAFKAILEQRSLEKIDSKLELPSQNRDDGPQSDFICNPEDQTALAILNQLQDIGFVGGHEFIEFPSIDNTAERKFKLSIYKGSLGGIFPPDNVLSFTSCGVVPAPKRVARKTKQDLASLALDTILRTVAAKNSESDRWFDLNFLELKNRLQQYHNLLVLPPTHVNDD